MRARLRTFTWMAFVATGALVLVGGAPFILSAQAAAAPSDVVTLGVTATRDPSTPFGWQRQFDAVDSLFALPVRTVTDGLQVEVGKRDGSDSFSIKLEPGWGQQLHVGSYPDVSPNAFPTDPVPRFEMYVRGTQMSAPTDVDVLDLAYDATGRITRADITFTWSPHIAASSYIGELTLNEPTSGVQVSTPHVALPDYVTPAVPLPVTERLRNVGSTSVTIGRLTTGGPDASDLSLAQDRCSGVRLRPGDTCTVVVRYSPTGSGPRAATVRVPATSAAGAVSVPDVSLSGDVDPNHSVITTWGDDFVDAGQRVVSREGPFQITAYSDDSERVVLDPSIVGPRGWPGIFGAANISVDVQAPSGGAITPGRHALGGSTGWNVSLSGFGRGCSIYDGVLNVNDISYVAGHLAHADLTFHGRCGSDQYGPVNGHVVYTAPSS